MKIAIVSEYYYPLLGGITEHVHFFSKECARLGHQVTIITSNAKGKTNYPSFPSFDGTGNIEVIRLGKSIPFYSNGSLARITIGFGIKRRMREIIQGGKFDMVHIHAPTIPVLPIIAQLVSKGPTVGTFHTYFEGSILYSFYRNGAQDALENLDGRIAVSKLCVDSLSKYFEADFEIIPNGVDIEYFSNPPGKIDKFDDGKINILFLARLDPRNGLEALIKAFKLIHRQYKNVRLIIVGDGPFKSYYQTLVDKNIEKDVCFEGFTNGLRPDYYNLCDIFCFPVQKASFGITLLEAMAAKKPIICSDLEAFHDILGNENTCSYINPFDEKEIAHKIMGLIENPDKRKQLAENARKRVYPYSWKNVTQEVLSFYDKILSNL